MKEIFWLRQFDNPVFPNDATQFLALYAIVSDFIYNFASILAQVQDFEFQSHQYDR